MYHAHYTRPTLPPRRRRRSFGTPFSFGSVPFRHRTRYGLFAFSIESTTKLAIAMACSWVHCIRFVCVRVCLYPVWPVCKHTHTRKGQQVIDSPSSPVASTNLVRFVGLCSAWTGSDQYSTRRRLRRHTSNQVEYSVDHVGMLSLVPFIHSLTHSHRSLDPVVQSVPCIPDQSVPGILIV